MNRKIFLLTLFTHAWLFSQEGIAVYTDYLTDNYYLVHPAMAGAGFEGGKLRMTLRKQWFDQVEAPELQTLSAHKRISNRSGVGAILFNDKNGYHSQTGLYLTYAHHINMYRSDVEVNQISFGISVGGIQRSLDESNFDPSDYDPIISGIKQSTGFFNVDAGVSYNLIDFYAHLTVRNLLFKARGLYGEIESKNQRNYLASIGYFISNPNRNWSLEPSLMFQWYELTKEGTIDASLKGFYGLQEGRLWAGISFRNSFKGAEYLDGATLSNQQLSTITPLIGIDYKNFIFAYNYSHQLGTIRFAQGGFHQITIGYNFGRPAGRARFVRGIL